MTATAVLTDVLTGERFVVDLRPDPLMRDDAWTTAAGETIPLGDMRDRHIERVIAFLRRRARSAHRRAIDRMQADSVGVFAPSGDAACDAFDAEFDALIYEDPREWLERTPIVRALKAELVLRSEPWGVA